MDAGITKIGDSRLENLLKLERSFGGSIEIICLRTPMISEMEDILDICDASMNTETDAALFADKIASSKGKAHDLVIMVETDDRREGILPKDLLGHCRFINQRCTNIRIKGIGTNARCISSKAPKAKSIQILCELKKKLKDLLGIELDIVSGGNSSIWDLIDASGLPGCINEVRIGEAILLGNETSGYRPIDGLHTDAFILAAEVIEIKHKNSRPYKLILALGIQDVNNKDIKCYNPYLNIIDQSSDHTVMSIDGKARPEDIYIGAKVVFKINYFGLLSLMTSPFVKKIFVDP